MAINTESLDIADATQVGVYAGLVFELDGIKGQIDVPITDSTGTDIGRKTTVGFKARPNTLGIDDPRIATVAITNATGESTWDVNVSVRSGNWSKDDRSTFKGTLESDVVDRIIIKQLALCALYPFEEYFTEFQKSLGDGIFMPRSDDLEAAKGS